MKISLVVFVLLLYSVVSFSNVFFSEIMFNPQGNERYNEFIELYNASQTDTIDLDGWLVGDADRLSTLAAYNENAKLLPKHYALVLVENYFINSSEYDSLIPHDCLILTINHSQIGAYGLSNSRGETVYLLKTDSTFVDSFQYTIPNDDGISEERISYESGTSQNNWANSLTIGGSPGYRNSVSPKSTDLAIVEQSLVISPNPPNIDNPALISVSVVNKGVEKISKTHLFFSWSYTMNGPFTLLETVPVSDLKYNETEIITKDWLLTPSGIYYISVQLECENDENTGNNCDTLQVIGGYPYGAVIVNEIMYSPQPGMPEWFEIINPNQTDVNLQYWLVYNSDDNPKTLTDSAVWLSSNSYAVIAKDSSIFEFMDTDAPLLVTPNFPGLKNESDSLVLRDATGNLVDRVDYTAYWGGAKGISIERLQPEINSNQQDNWKSCVDVNGHTAGRENSIYTEILPTVVDLQLGPNPFSPDGDGIEDHAAITWSLPDFTSNINIRIFDAVGRQVRFLCNNLNCASSGTVFWDGLNEEGICCRMGIYIVLLECIEYGKGITNQHTSTLVLAKNL